MTFNVTIGSVTIETYTDVNGAKNYLAGSIGDGAVAFFALDDTDAAGVLSKSSCIAAATRYLEAQLWQGVPTTPAVGGTTLSWPRTGVVDAYGNAVDSQSVPANLISAVCELAAIFADDQDVFAAADQGSNLKGVRGGPAGVDYFVPTTAQDGSAPLMPEPAQRLVGQYLATSGDTVGGGIVTGGCKEENEHEARKWDRAWPF